MTAPTTEAAALRAILHREPIELGEGVTPERVIALALTTIDLGYRVHPENGRANMLAVEADWIMQRWAAAEAAATAARAEIDRLRAALSRIAERPENYDDGISSYAVGYAFSAVQQIARSALARSEPRKDTP